MLVQAIMLHYMNEKIFAKYTITVTLILLLHSFVYFPVTIVILLSQGQS